MITSGTHNTLILIRFARYHNLEGSSILSYKYNWIPCIICHCGILLKGYMPIKIQHLMSPYCLKSIHHLHISKSYVFHRSIFKVMITNSFLLGALLFLGSDTLILRLNPCLDSGGLVQSALKQNFWWPLEMEQDPPSCHLVNVFAHITCIITSTYEGGFQLIHFMLIWNLFMEASVFNYIHIKLGSLLATSSLIKKWNYWRNILWLIPLLLCP